MLGEPVKCTFCDRVCERERRQYTGPPFCDACWFTWDSWDDVPPEVRNGDSWLRQRYEQGFPPKVEDPTALDAVATLIIEPEPAGFVCPRCGAVSHNPTDVAERYCGRCHEWTGADGGEA